MTRQGAFAVGLVACVIGAGWAAGHVPGPVTLWHWAIVFDAALFGFYLSCMMRSRDP